MLKWNDRKKNRKEMTETKIKKFVLIKNYMYLKTWGFFLISLEDENENNALWNKQWPSHCMDMKNMEMIRSKNKVLCYYLKL